MMIPNSQTRRHAARLMIRLMLVAAISFLAASCNRPSWIEFRGNGGLGKADALIQTPVAVKWKLSLSKQDEEYRSFNQPLILEDDVYFGSSDGNFYSLDLNSGYMNWSFRSGGPINSVPYADDTAVYFGSTDAKIYALDRKSGEMLWSFTTGGQLNSTVVPHEDMIIAAADADKFYFLGTDGQLRFTLSNGRWSHNSFQIFDEVLAFSPSSNEDSGTLAVYDLAQRQYRWELSESAQTYYWYSFPAVKHDRLFYSATGIYSDVGWIHYFSAIDFDSGEILWEQVDDAVIRGQEPDIETSIDSLLKNVQLLDYGAPTLWRNQVIFSMGDSAVRSYRDRDGKELWQYDYGLPLSTAITLAGDRLYFGLEAPADGASSGQLICADPADGSILWSIPVEGSILNAPVIAGKWIVFGTDEGAFYVLESIF